MGFKENWNKLVDHPVLKKYVPEKSSRREMLAKEYKAQNQFFDRAVLYWVVNELLDTQDKRERFGMFLNESLDQVERDNERLIQAYDKGGEKPDSVEFVRVLRNGSAEMIVNMYKEKVLRDVDNI